MSASAGKRDQPPLIDPEATFESPMALANDRSLSATRKLELLEHWEFTVNARLSAANEGMPMGANKEARDSELIRKIEAAKQLLLSEAGRA